MKDSPSGRPKMKPQEKSTESNSDEPELSTLITVLDDSQTFTPAGGTEIWRVNKDWRSDRDRIPEDFMVIKKYDLTDPTDLRELADLIESEEPR